VDASKVWSTASGVGSALSAILLGLLSVATWKNGQASQRSLAEQASALEALRREIKSTTASTWLDAQETAHNCYADNTSVTCTVTNLRDEPITTCLAGKLAQKKAGGVTLSSLTVCTGRLGPRETRTATAPWVGGFARDICHSVDRWGNLVLDWEACRFGAEPVKLSVAERPDPTPDVSAALVAPASQARR
jgi:hypothetical protein